MCSGAVSLNFPEYPWRRYCILRTTEQILGLFVLIWMHLLMNPNHWYFRSLVFSGVVRYSQILKKAGHFTFSISNLNMNPSSLFPYKNIDCLRLVQVLKKYNLTYQMMASSHHLASIWLVSLSSIILSYFENEKKKKLFTSHLQRLSANVEFNVLVLVELMWIVRNKIDYTSLFWVRKAYIRGVADSRTAGTFMDTELRVTVHWITLKTCRIPYEIACRTGVRNLSIDVTLLAIKLALTFLDEKKSLLYRIRTLWKFTFS